MAANPTGATKRIERLESLGQLILEEATNLRKELGLIPTPAPRKGLTDLEIAQVVLKRKSVINNRKYEQREPNNYPTKRKA